MRPADGAAPGPRRRRAFAALAAGLGLLVALALGEALVRLVAPQPTGPPLFAFDAAMGAYPAPGLRGRVTVPGAYAYTFAHDAAGHRVTPPDRPGARHRVLLLGDSFAYGMGVDDDATLAARLEAHLARTPAPAEVVNAGNPTTGTDYALRYVEAHGAALRPDAVVLAFTYNDYLNVAAGLYYDLGPGGARRAVPSRDAFSRRKAFLRHLPGYALLMAHSHLATLLKRAAIEGVGGAPANAGAALPGAGGAPTYSTPENAALAAYYLGALAEATRRLGAPLLVLYVPAAEELAAFRATGRPSADERRLAAACARHGLPCYSSTAVLARSGRPVEALYYPESHWRAAAHRLAAAALAPALEAALAERPPR